MSTFVFVAARSSASPDSPERGRTEVLRAIFGADPIDAGEITVFGEPTRIRKPHDAVDLGIGLLTEDRKADGLLMSQSLAFNVTITQLGRRVDPAVLSHTQERRTVERHIARLAIRTPAPSAFVRNLSGGNQQKAIFAKWLHAPLPDPARSTSRPAASTSAPSTRSTASWRPLPRAASPS